MTSLLLSPQLDTKCVVLYRCYGLSLSVIRLFLPWMFSTATNLHKQGDASVGHRVRQAQDAAPHNGIAEVEHGHAEWGVALVLWRWNKGQEMNQRMEWEDLRRRDSHIRSRTSSCPGCVRGGSFDSLLRQCHHIGFKKKWKTKRCCFQKVFFLIFRFFSTHL